MCVHAGACLLPSMILLAHCLTLKCQANQHLLQAIPGVNAILIRMQVEIENEGLLRLGCYEITFAAKISENCCCNGALQQWRPADL